MRSQEATHTSASETLHTLSSQRVERIFNLLQASCQHLATFCDRRVLLTHLELLNTSLNELEKW